MKDNDKKLNKSKISKIVDFVRGTSDQLYRNTYFSNSDNTKDLDSIKGSISSSIDKIINTNVDNIGAPNISILYNRVSKSNEQVEDIFSEKNITDSILSSLPQNKYIKDYDDEINLICKYMPSLEDALDAKKDNVLSTDHFSKDFINVINKTNLTNESEFNARMDIIKEKYNLLELLEQFYSDTAKYGEEFIYIIPYSDALTKLVNNNNNVVTESFNCKEIIHECNIKITDTTLLNEAAKENINIRYNHGSILESGLAEYNTIQSVLEKTTIEKPLVDSELEFESPEELKSAEGVFNKSSINKDKKDKVNIPGCIIKRLERANVIPLYINDTCLGYYYIEFSGINAEDVFSYKQSSMGFDSMSASKFNKFASTVDAQGKDNILQTLSTKLSKFIDSKFINANQDLKEEIYTILKYNDGFLNKGSNMNITYISPENMIHMYFDKDKTTNRGISDLENSLIPAKLYISLYTTNTLGILTRSHDKRVYYVKQTVDSNISKTLLNTLNQIKKSNFGTREFGSIKNILNITGRFDDYIIPVGPSGDSPIQFEVMPGQQIDTNQDLLDQLENAAINATDVPYEYVQSRKNVDYAVRLTMSSGKFLRKVFKRQAILEKFFSRIINIIYKTEYDSTDTLEFMLPPPAFLNILNTNQMLENVDRYVEAILSMVAPNSDDQVFVSKLQSKLKRHYLSSYLDIKAIDIITQEAKMEVEKEKNSEDQENMQ